MLQATVERYRDRWSNSKGKHRKVATLAKNDALPKREKMSASHKHHYLGNINQIRRYLSNQCGRPWDAVYSELVNMTGKDSIERVELERIINAYVDLTVIEENGVLIAQSGYTPCRLRAGDIYVFNGILNRMPHREVSKPSSTLKVTFTDQMKGVGIANGQWFEVTFAQHPGGQSFPYDVYLRKTVSRGETLFAYGKTVYATSKRAMGKQEIRRFKAGCYFACTNA